MNSSTTIQTDAGEKAAQLFGSYISMHITEHPDANIGDIENWMREELQEIGRRSLEIALTSSDKQQPSTPCTCGEEAIYRFRRHAKTITVFGQVQYKRSYYSCSCGKGVAPLDRQMQIEPGQLSRGVVPLLALLGIQTSFGEAKKLAKQLLLLDISDNSIRKATKAMGTARNRIEVQMKKESCSPAFLMQRERIEKDAPTRLYGSMDGVLIPVDNDYYELKIGSWYTVDPIPKRQWPSRYKQRVGQLEALKATEIEYYSDTSRAPEFSGLVWGTGCRRLADRAKELVFVADGAKWIWNIVDENFPNAVQILDWYHAVEYLTPIARSLLSKEEEQEKWLVEMKTHLWFSRTKTVIDACLALGQNPTVSKVALEAATYYSNNLNRMDYVEFRNQGYLIGSGTIESGCKQIGTMRMKRSGAQWTENGANLVAKARAAWLSDQWESLTTYYQQLPLVA